MTDIKAAYKNILENAMVTLAQGGENPSYPLYRLYDRDIGRLFTGSAAATTIIKIAQSGTILPVDRLIIPAGHNLSGVSMNLKYSSNDSTYYDAVTGWTQPDTGLIHKEFAGQTKQYWKLYINTPAQAPSLAELFLSAAYAFAQPPTYPVGEYDPEFNVENVTDAAGHDRFIQHGNAKRQRNYDLSGISSAMADEITALNALWAGKKPFYLIDENAVVIFGKLKNKIALKRTSHTMFSATINFLEVLS